MTRFRGPAMLAVALGVLVPVLSAPAPAQNSSGGNPYAKEPKLLFTSKANWGPYIFDLQTRLNQAWKPPKQAETKVPVMLFKVHDSGSLVETRVLRSSGDASIDRLAQSTMQSTQIKPLPQGAPSDVYFEVTFDTHMFNVRLLMRPPMQAPPR